MNRIGIYASLAASIFLAAIAFDLSAAKILCKQQGFTCPIVENMSFSGSSHNYSTGSYEGTWTAAGPWGSGGATITINGKSRCSATSGSSYTQIGNPVAVAGRYCWCQMTNNGVSGAWAFQYVDHGDASGCALVCANGCAYDVRNLSGFRPGSCVPDPYCDGTTAIADGACSAGYMQCIGSTTGGDDAGEFAISCSE